MSTERLVRLFRVSIVLSIAILMGGCEEVPEPTKPGTDFYYFRVMWIGDAATEATVGWSSRRIDTDEMALYYDTEDHGNDLDGYRYVAEIDRQEHAFVMDNNFVRLKNLKPRTKYYFVVAGEDEISATYWFETASDDSDDPIALIVGGDSRNNHLPRTRANSLVAKLRPHAVMFNGDMTNLGTYKQWQRWFEDWQLTIAGDGRITPIIPARGNHETSNKILHDLFDVPKDNYYTVSLHDDLLKVFTLNSESSIAGNQYTWLRDELENSQSFRWKIAQYHSPMRPHVKGKKEGDLAYTYWAPLLYEYGVNIVAEADSHTLKTTWPLRPSQGAESVEGFVRDDEDGMVFIGEGCWGAPLRGADDNKAWTRDSASLNHFMWVWVAEEGIEIRTILVDGADDVEFLGDDNRFDIPRGLDVWSPPNGSVVSIGHSLSGSLQ